MSEQQAMAVVSRVGEMSFDGNIIPQSWFQHIKFPSGKPHLTAIVILSEIVYWYRPREIREESSGRFLGYQKKFKGDALQRSYDSFAEQFGVGKREATDALKYLAALGIITLDLRTVMTEMGTRLPNVLFILLHPEKLREITYPRHNGTYPPSKRNTPSGGTEQGVRANGGPPAPGRNTNTESNIESLRENNNHPTTHNTGYEKENSSPTPAGLGEGNSLGTNQAESYPLLRYLDSVWWQPVVHPAGAMRPLLPISCDPDPRDAELLEGILRNFAVGPGGLPGLLLTLTTRFNDQADPRFRRECLQSMRPMRLLWARLEELYRRMNPREEHDAEHPRTDTTGAKPGTSARGSAGPRTGRVGGGGANHSGRSDAAIYPHPPCAAFPEDDAGVVSYDW